ncbi:MAG: hypothetical protein ACFFCD_14955 [Promethearchaeota archaeon]
MSVPDLPRNYITKEKARVKSDKNISVEKLESLLEIAYRNYISSRVFRSKALLNGIIIELVTNSAHQYDFWLRNWWVAPDEVLPHGIIYSVYGVEGMDPAAYYCPERYTAVFVNTEYYGQCKSWALGIAAIILEKQFNTHSLHSACVDVDGKGVAIIAPTGTGKSTQAFKLFKRPNAKILGDDWLYIKHPLPGEDKPLIGRQPEKSLYMRTDAEENEPWLRDIFDKSPVENVEIVEGQGECMAEDCEGWCYHCFGNSRAIIKREDLLGPEKVADETIVSLVVLLRRDKVNPAEVWLNPQEAGEVLKKGEYMIRPGAGPREKWGKMGNEPYYNPYLLELSHERQQYYFSKMFDDHKVPCILLNTGVEGVEATYQRIVEAIDSPKEPDPLG